MTPQEFQEILTQTLEDRHLSTGERHALSEIITEAAFDDRNRAVYRHMAFELAEKRCPIPGTKTFFNG